MNKTYLRIVLLLLILPGFYSLSCASDEKFDSQDIIAEVEKNVELSSEKMAKLKPELDSKSAELKKSVQETVDKGFLQLDALSDKLAKATKEAEKKAKQLLNSDEYKKFKEVLTSIDKEAIEEAKTKMGSELAAILKLTEDQAKKLKPVLDEGMEEFSQIISDLQKAGASGWEEFTTRYQELSEKFRSRFEKSLEPEQLDELDKYYQQKKEKIHRDLIEV